MAQQGFLLSFDFSRCVGCRHCEIACAVEHSTSKTLEGAVHEWPRPKPRIRVFRIAALSLPITCRHCADPPCVKVCPSGAMYRTQEGFVLHNPAKCIGCKLCEIACPLAHPRYDPELRLLLKCDLCQDRLRQGRLPACVEACKTGAIKLVTPDELTRARAESLLLALTQPGVTMLEQLKQSLIVQLHESYRNATWLE